MSTVENKLDYTGLTVGKIVAKDYRKAMVFKSYNIDFCCGGNTPLDQACKSAGANMDQVLYDLEAVDKESSELTSFDTMSVLDLIDFIVDKHHAYTTDTLMKLEPMVNKVSMVHGGWRPELKKIESLFAELKAELLPHLMKEETILFPAMKALVNGLPSPFDSTSIQNPISMMEYEHDSAGVILKEIRELSDGYTLPKGACATYTVVYRILEDFEADLFQHIHLENNILFPKVLALKDEA